MMAQKKEKPTNEKLPAEKIAKEPKSKVVKKSKPDSQGKETAEKQATPAVNADLAESQHETEFVEKSVRKADRGALLLGAGLLFLGALLLASRLLNISLGGYLWPFIFIVPGALLFWSALTTESDSAEGLSILGGILIMLGLIFLLQSVSGFWASWTYAWALIVPTSIGISQMVFGSQKGRDNIYQSGVRLTRLGLWIFLIGFAFFELIIGVSGFGLRRFGLPVIPMMLIFAGVFILVRSLARRK